MTDQSDATLPLQPVQPDRDDIPLPDVPDVPGEAGTAPSASRTMVRLWVGGYEHRFSLHPDEDLCGALRHYMQCALLQAPRHSGVYR